MTSLYCPKGSSLYGIVTDRKDFYRQAKVTTSRAESNSLPFSYEATMFDGDPALKRLDAHLDDCHGPREVVGDRYGKPGLGRRRKGLLVGETQVFPAFKSLYQGDHLGVEFALSSHSSMLEDWGLLRILGHRPFPLGPDYEGLVIDDYFSISCHPFNDSSRPACLEHLRVATLAYDKESVLGSPEKDVVGSQHFAVVGAEIDSSQKARSRGTILVAASLPKRLSLASLSLRAAALPVISRELWPQGCQALGLRCLCFEDVWFPYWMESFSLV